MENAHLKVCTSVCRPPAARWQRQGLANVIAARNRSAKKLLDSGCGSAASKNGSRLLAGGWADGSSAMLLGPGLPCCLRGLAGLHSRLQGSGPVSAVEVEREHVKDPALFGRLAARCRCSALRSAFRPSPGPRQRSLKSSSYLCLPNFQVAADRQDVPLGCIGPHAAVLTS